MHSMTKKNDDKCVLFQNLFVNLCYLIYLINIQKIQGKKIIKKN